MTHLKLDEYVIAARAVMNPPRNTRWREDPTRPASEPVVWRLVDRGAKRPASRHTSTPIFFATLTATM